MTIVAGVVLPGDGASVPRSWKFERYVQNEFAKWQYEPSSDRYNADSLCFF